jgi:predicted esterase
LNTRTLATQTHGRYLVDLPEHAQATLVGFHGYQENAAINFDVLRQIAASPSTSLRASRSIGIVSVQGLHRFYPPSRPGRSGPPSPGFGVASAARTPNDVVASWMTSEDRDLAIADNVAYVAGVLSAVAGEDGMMRPLVYVGFSQGVAMAYRAATLVQRPCDGIIALAGDVPPDVAPLASSLPPTLLGRGRDDKWYTAEKAAADLAVLRAAGVRVAEEVFDGGHAWVPAFIARSGRFLDELLSL